MYIGMTGKRVSYLCVKKEGISPLFLKKFSDCGISMERSKSILVLLKDANKKKSYRTSWGEDRLPQTPWSTAVKNCHVCKQTNTNSFLWSKSFIYRINLIYNLTYFCVLIRMREGEHLSPCDPLTLSNKLERQE